MSGTPAGPVSTPGRPEIPTCAKLHLMPRLARFRREVVAAIEAAKAQILRRVTELSGAQLSRVDIRISGATITDGGRVR